MNHKSDKCKYKNKQMTEGKLCASYHAMMTQYDKYFTSFSYFATYSTSVSASEITAKYEKQVKQLSVLHETDAR